LKLVDDSLLAGELGGYNCQLLQVFRSKLCWLILLLLKLRHPKLKLIDLLVEFHFDAPLGGLDQNTASA
jgi:hypothetical protein